MEIYAASVALSEISFLSYVTSEMGMEIERPFKLQVDNAACLAFSKEEVRRSKLRHIDCRQEWVQALRDSDVADLQWVASEANFADLFTKILEAETFTRLRDQIMVFEPIPADQTQAAATDCKADAALTGAPAGKLPVASAFMACSCRASCHGHEEAIRNPTFTRNLEHVLESSGVACRRSFSVIKERPDTCDCLESRVPGACRYVACIS